MATMILIGAIAVAAVAVLAAIVLAVWNARLWRQRDAALRERALYKFQADELYRRLKGSGVAVGEAENVVRLRTRGAL